MLTIIVGGFFGDEGKGKIAAYLGLKDKPKIAVRCGAINAGHTVVLDGQTWKLRIIPSAFLNKETRLMIPAGALIKIDLLHKEIVETGVTGRLFIDFKTGIIENQHVEYEKKNSVLTDVIGSTLQGVGAAMADRVLRRLKLAKDIPELKNMLTDVSHEVNDAVDKGENVIIEGTQGTFLSLYHGTYPFVTSRDTTAQAFASEVGVGCKKVDEIIVVFKSYVTRVGQGPLDNELSPDEIVKRGWIEKGTVTGRPRRVAPFDFKLARKAVILNSATQAAITKLDSLFPEAKNVTKWDKLPRNAKAWIEETEEKLKVPVTLIGTGPDVKHTIDRRKEVGIQS